MVEISFLDEKSLPLLFFSDSAFYERQLPIFLVVEVELVEIVGKFAVLVLHDAESAEVEAAEGGFGLALEIV